MKSNKKPGTSWKKRLGGAAAGVCVAAVIAAGVGASTGGASAATVSTKRVVATKTSGPAPMSLMSTGWGG